MNEQQLHRIDEILAPVDPSGPGLSLAILSHGALTYSRSIGLANLDYQVPITTGTAFRVASLAKQFTGMCVALLELDGKLSLEDDIRRYLPEMPDYGTTITVDHLLRHTSGLQDFCHLLWAIAGRPFGDAFCEAELLLLLSRQRELNFPPGERHLYANAGYFLLSVIVERVSGMRLSQFARQRIFAKLGMVGTHFHDDNTLIVPHRAVGYAPDAGSPCRYRISDMPTTTLVGDDGLFTTVDDLIRWDANFRHNDLGGGQELIDRILAPGKLNNGERVLYGYGHFLGQRRGLERFWHYGEFLGFQSVIRCFPGQGLTIICLANSSAIAPVDIAVAIEDILLANSFGPIPASEPDEQVAPPTQAPRITPTELMAYEGRYVNAELGVVYTISSDGTRLTMTNADPHAVAVPPMDAVGPDTFRVRLQQLWPRDIRFSRGQGRVTGFVIVNPEERATPFVKVD